MLRSNRCTKRKRLRNGFPLLDRWQLESAIVRPQARRQAELARFYSIRCTFLHGAHRPHCLYLVGEAGDQASMSGVAVGGVLIRATRQSV